MVSKLTDHANIEALSELESKLSPTAPANRAINEATNALLEPIFLRVPIRMRLSSPSTREYWTRR